MLLKRRVRFERHLGNEPQHEKIWGAHAAGVSVSAASRNILCSGLRNLNLLSARVAAVTLKEMSTLQEIKSAIANLSPHDKALLTAELFATNAEPDDGALEAALERGLKDIEAGRVHPVEEVKAMIPRWTSKS